jgi:hypothetical protein
MGGGGVVAEGAGGGGGGGTVVADDGGAVGGSGVGALLGGDVGAVDGVDDGSAVVAGEPAGGALEPVDGDGPGWPSGSTTAPAGPGDPAGAAPGSPPSAGTTAVVLAVPATVKGVADISTDAPRADDDTVASAAGLGLVSAWRARVESPSYSCSPSADPLAIIELLPKMSTAAIAHGRHGERGGGLVAHPVAPWSGAVDTA